MATVSIDWIHFAITWCILTSIDHMIISPFSFDEARSRPSGENNSEWTDFEHLRIRFCFISSSSNGFHTTIDPSCNPLAKIIVINEVQRIETKTPFLVEIVLDGSSTITTVLWVHDELNQAESLAHDLSIFMCCLSVLSPIPLYLPKTPSQPSKQRTCYNFSGRRFK